MIGIDSRHPAAEEFMMLWEDLVAADKAQDYMALKVCTRHAREHFERFARLLAAGKIVPSIVTVQARHVVPLAVEN